MRRAIVLHLDLEWKINRFDFVLKTCDEVGFELMTSGLIVHFSTKIHNIQ